LVVAVKD
jgi:hypothetical protein